MKVSLGKSKVLLTFLFLLLTLNFLSAQTLRHPVNEPNEQGQDVRPTGHVIDVPAETMAAQPAPKAVVQGNGINYHGGPVLHGNVPIYVIWYGNWTNGPKASDSQTTVNLIDAFLGGLGGSALEGVNTTYGDNTANVSGLLHLQSQIFDTGSQGTNLSNTRLTNLISSHLANGSLPTDSTGVYLVLTSSNVSERGFCTQFCGFHTAQTINGQNIKWAFVGNVDKCPSGCEAQTTSPNGDSGADGMANTLSHEIEEAISDPDLNAWFDSSGQENGDKCNFNFGAVQTASNGSKFNQTFGGHNWLLQQNWRNSGGGACAQHL
ncbi:MAG TPA: hypothetical protein VHA33_19095 [Candidatus Angelobacter sp.]|jgi:hypothetical protein|nr:hypothetical protein [Candidatus Angelobacter sp.]